MTPPDQPTQGDVLRDRFSRVPWRTMLSSSFREWRGNGPTALPDRLEGAVLGCVAADGDPAGVEHFLGGLERLLDGVAAAPAATRAADYLPVALVLRDRDDASLARAAAAFAGGGPSPHVAGPLLALVARRLLAGERSRRAALAGATRALSAVPGWTDEGTAERDAGFQAGWEAFVASGGYREAVEGARTAGSHGAEAPALAGALAGLYWGSDGIPPSLRRAIPGGARARALVDRLIETDRPGWDGEPWRTSSSSPLRVDALDLGGLGLAGQAGITSLPGRRYVGYHTGAHWRDLDTDATRLRDLGIGTLLLLVEDTELRRCRATGMAEAMAADRRGAPPVPDPRPARAARRGSFPRDDRSGPRARPVRRLRGDRVPGRAGPRRPRVGLPAARGGPRRTGGDRARPGCSSRCPDPARPAGLRAGVGDPRLT